MNIYRTIFSYLMRKAGPVGLTQSKVPVYDDADYYRDRRQKSHRNYWKFVDDHKVELSADEHEALKEYRGYSGDLNTYLRGRVDYLNKQYMKNPELLDDLDRQSEHISKAVLRSPLKRPVTVWRSLKFAKGEPIYDKLQSMGLVSSGSLWEWARKPTKAELDSLIGFKFREPAFSSTTLIPDGMWKNSMIKLRILLDRGQPALVTNSSYWFNKDEKNFSEGKDHYWAQEHELLLDKNTLFEVESARFEGDARYYRKEGQLYLTVRVVDK